MRGLVKAFFILISVAASLSAQSSTNRIWRPCPGTTTAASVQISTGASGGAVTARTCSGYLGEISLTTGTGTSGSVYDEAADGGDFAITTGGGGTTTAAQPSGQGGTIRIFTGAGGSSTVAAGNTSGTGGNIFITPGTGGARTGASGTAGAGGALNLDGGVGGTGSGGASSGAAGAVNIGPTNATRVNIGRANSKTSIGDILGTGNNTLFSLDDAAGEVTISGAYLSLTTGLDLQSGNILIYRTITAGGTTGNVTINKLSGTVNIAAGAGTAGVTVTNSLVTANSIVYAIARTNDATCSVKSVVPASGSFVLRTTANCTAETSFGFLVTN